MCLSTNNGHICVAVKSNVTVYYGETASMAWTVPDEEETLFIKNGCNMSADILVSYISNVAHYTNESIVERFNISETLETLNLTIRNVRFLDAGEYYLQSVNGTAGKTCYLLYVLGKQL